MASRIIQPKELTRAKPMRSHFDCTLKGNSSTSVLNGKGVVILATDGFEPSELWVRPRLAKAG